MGFAAQRAKEGLRHSHPFAQRGASGHPQPASDIGRERQRLRYGGGTRQLSSQQHEYGTLVRVREEALVGRPRLNQERPVLLHLLPSRFPRYPLLDRTPDPHGHVRVRPHVEGPWVWALGRRTDVADHQIVAVTQEDERNRPRSPERRPVAVRRRIGSFLMSDTRPPVRAAVVAAQVRQRVRWPTFPAASPRFGLLSTLPARGPAGVMGGAGGRRGIWGIARRCLRNRSRGPRRSTGM